MPDDGSGGVRHGRGRTRRRRHRRVRHQRPESGRSTNGARLGNTDGPVGLAGRGLSAGRVPGAAAVPGRPHDAACRAPLRGVLRMKGTWLGVLTVALMSVGACSSGYGGAPARGKLTQARAVVFGWNDARVGALLIDRNGRQTGWKRDRSIREIAGCMLQSGSEEGIPDEAPPDTFVQTTPADTVQRQILRTPMYHYFTIEDSADVPGLLHQGGCELRLDPVVGGKVQLTLLASGVGFSECKDTTSVWVKPGIPSRLWLSWKTAGDSCRVRISQMAARKPGSSPK